jgi:hypothetical protein
VSINSLVEGNSSSALVTVGRFTEGGKRRLPLRNAVAGMEDAAAPAHCSSSRASRVSANGVGGCGGRARFIGHGSMVVVVIVAVSSEWDLVCSLKVVR